MPRMASMHTCASTHPARDLKTWTTVSVRSKSKNTIELESFLLPVADGGSSLRKACPIEAIHIHKA